MIDTHCHLTHSRLADDLSLVLGRASKAGLLGCISIGTGVADGRSVAELVARHPGFLWGTAGIDPFTTHRLGDAFDEELAALEELLREGPFCALGEVGLDFHYDLDPPSLQAERLERQLDLARRLDLPVVIHVREAHAEMAALLARHPDNRGVIHSFTEGPEWAARYLELGWFLAFNGVATFRNGEANRDAARIVPIERLLFETDSPYLAPVPLRGKRCEPSYVLHTLERVAEVRGDDPRGLIERTNANARELFGLS